jgi:alpha-tubulin suppressor-like RCC1 family protein
MDRTGMNVRHAAARQPRLTLRSMIWTLALLASCGPGVAPARADDRPGLKIRLDQSTAQAAVSGAEYAGTLEITAAKAGVIDAVEIGGQGWRQLSVELSGPTAVAVGEVLKVPFRASVLDSSKRIEIRARLDGTWTRKRLDLSPQRFARANRPRPTVRLESPGHTPTAGEQQSDDGSAGQRGCDDQLIHFHGRIAYYRAGVDNNGDGDFTDAGVDNSSPPDGDFDDPGDVPPDLPSALIGADRIWFEVMDDDLIDETIVSSYTNEDGSFDVTVCWDDCDASGCDDPDIYLRFECDTDVVSVQDGEDVFEHDYNWSTEDSQYYGDYTGHDIDFGTVLPADAGEYPALHIHNAITRAHRFIEENDGAYIDHVDVQWPETETKYTRFFEEIYLERSEQWNEATQTHEWGHHLLYEWTSPVNSDYCNGFCDDNDINNNGCTTNEECDGNGGHCVWCNETDHDAWNEGFPNWLGSVAVRGWRARYSIAPWTQLAGMNGDGRYTLETPQACCSSPPAALHDAWITEGFVGAMLRDIDDPAPEIPAGPPFTCPQDSLDMTPRDILTVVREAQPIRIIEFLQAFWTRHPERAHDIRNAALAVAPVYGNLWPTPPIELYQTPSCDTAVAGQPISLHVETNGSRWSLNMRWHRNGVPLSDTATRSGSFTDTLTINNSTSGDSGSYTLVLSSCDGTQSRTSAPIPVYVFGGNGPGHRVTGWGRNAFGSLGRGSFDPQNDANPADVINLSNVVDVSAGYWNAVALLADGTVRSWGAFYLGDGTANNSATPVTVTGLSNIVAVSAGGYETCMALDANGHVWTWGSNYYGQIGDGTEQPRLTPLLVPSLSCVVAISMGAFSTAAVTADGRLWTWGNNSYGELGLGVSGGWYTTPQLVPGLTNVVEVECGWSHLIARRSDGSVWCSGSNAQGQLGDGTFNSRNTFGQVPGLSDVISVKAGALHSLAVRSDWTPWGWGFNSGNLGTVDMANNPNPTRPIAPLTVRSLDAGYLNSLFVDTDGVIWTCGYWANGALGRPSNNYLPAPVDLRVGAAVRASAGIDFMLVISPGTRITSPVADQLAAGCGTTRLHVGAIGEPPIDYQWRRFNGANWEPVSNGGRFSGANSPTLTISPTNTNDTTQYDVAVINDTNQVFSVPVTLVTPPLLQNFEAGQNPLAWWSNERGAWAATGGGYAAALPSFGPATYNSFRLPQTDFSIELDVIRASLGNFTANSGIWLRSKLDSQEPTGVLLALGDVWPWSTSDVYWTRWNGTTWQAPEGVVSNVYGEGDSVHIRVDVRGNVYSAFINDSASPTTQLISPDYPAGKLGLFDNATTDTLFDNVFIQSLPSCDPGSGMTPASVVQRPQSQSVAAGSPVALSVVANGTGPLTYQWLRNGICISGANAPSYAFTASSSTAGRYECTVSNVCGSVGSFPAIVTVAGGGPTGDLDGDGHVGLADLALILSAFGSCAGAPTYNPQADFNGDGCVSLADLAMLLANFGT